MKLLLVIIFFYHPINCQLHCDKYNNYIHKYNLLHHCQRSNKTIVGLGRFLSVEDCAKFARNNRGLAFNYSPPGRGDFNLFTKQLFGDSDILIRNDAIVENTINYYNCHVLDCPEIGIVSGMINDTRYDYYSMYSSRKLTTNITCIPTVGLFVIFTDVEMRNYTEASNVCRYNIDGAMAHILSETRTNLLSKLIDVTINGNQQDMAFVGLQRTVNVTSWHTSTGEPIDCFRYRAWAPGHPPTLIKRQKVKNCVAITKQRTWKAVECSEKMSFVCEIYTRQTTDVHNKLVSSNNLYKKCSINKRNNYP